MMTRGMPRFHRCPGVQLVGKVPSHSGFKNNFELDKDLAQFVPTGEYIIPVLDHKAFVTSVQQYFGPSARWSDDEIEIMFNVTRDALRDLASSRVCQPDEVWDSLDKHSSVGLPWSYYGWTKLNLLASGDTPKILVVKLQKLFREFPDAQVCLFYLFLKQELIKRKKAAEGRHRTICGSPVDLTLLTGMLSKDFNECIERNRLRCPIRVGINPFSMEWTHLAEDLRRFRNFWFVDIRGHEFSVTPEEMEMCCHLRISKMREKRLASLFRRVYRETEFPVAMSPSGDIYQLVGKVKSGCFNTCHDNSLISLSRILLCFQKLCPDLNWREHVCLCVFGDDIGLSCSDDAAKRFNPESIRLFFRQHGIEVTGPSDFVPFEEFDFLSFTFREHPFYSGVWAPKPIRVDKLLMSCCVFPSDMQVSERLIRLCQISRVAAFNDGLWCDIDRIISHFVSMHDPIMAGNAQWEQAKSLRLDQVALQGMLDGLPVQESAHDLEWSKINLWLQN